MNNLIEVILIAGYLVGWILTTRRTIYRRIGKKVQGTISFTAVWDWDIIFGTTWGRNFETVFWAAIDALFWPLVASCRIVSITSRGIASGVLLTVPKNAYELAEENKRQKQELEEAQKIIDNFGQDDKGADEDEDDDVPDYRDRRGGSSLR